MDNITIIGAGNVAHILGSRAVAGGNAVEITGRDAVKAAALASELGGVTTTGTFGNAPTGDIVILALPYGSSVPVVTGSGDALGGKILVDISNPFDGTGTGLTTPEGTSAAQEIALVAPLDASVVKAFNTVLGHVLADQVGRSLSMCSSPVTTKKPKRVCRGSSRASRCARWTPATSRWRTGSREPA